MITLFLIALLFNQSTEAHSHSTHENCSQRKVSSIIDINCSVITSNQENLGTLMLLSNSENQTNCIELNKLLSEDRKINILTRNGGGAFKQDTKICLSNYLRNESAPVIYIEQIVTGNGTSTNIMSTYTPKTNDQNSVQLRIDERLEQNFRERDDDIFLPTKITKDYDIVVTCQ